jgi:hypothetical protein
MSSANVYLLDAYFKSATGKTAVGKSTAVYENH